MNEYKTNAAENGQVTIDDITVALIQQPYSDIDNTYKAYAINENGDDYEVIWSIVCESDNADEQCDWDNPAEIRKL